MLKSMNDVNGHDISRLARHLAFAIGDEHNKWHRYERENRELATSEKYCLAQFISQTLWEIKNCGQIQTHPDDLIDRAELLFDATRCRWWKGNLLIWLGRAFTRRFVDFENIPRRKWEFSRINYYDHWQVFNDGYGKFFAKPSEYSGRKFFIKEAPHYLKKFGKYIVCERYYDYGLENGACHELMEARIVPFNDRGAANMFILQLIDSLNYDDESDWSWSRKFVREVVAQAPVEQMLIEEEQERIRREEQRKIEQAKAEKARLEVEKRVRQAEKERKAAERAKLERGLREGFRVYIFGFEHDIIKIGMSNNVIKRKSEVQGGLAVVKICCTDKLTSGDARHFEKLCHEHFDDRRKKNVSGREYFEHVPYDEACDYLRSLVGGALINIDSEVES